MSEYMWATDPNVLPLRAMSPYTFELPTAVSASQRVSDILGLYTPEGADRGQPLTESSGLLVPETPIDPISAYWRAGTMTGAEYLAAMAPGYTAYVDYLSLMTRPLYSPLAFGTSSSPVEDVEDEDGYVYWSGYSDSAAEWHAEQAK
jgi:hypothetical protein